MAAGDGVVQGAHVTGLGLVSLMRRSPPGTLSWDKGPPVLPVGPVPLVSLDKGRSSMRRLRLSRVPRGGVPAGP